MIRTKKGKKQLPIKKFSRKSKLLSKYLSVKKVYPMDAEKTKQLKLATKSAGRFLYSVETMNQDGKKELSVLSFEIKDSTNFYVNEDGNVVVQLKPNAEVVAEKFSEDDIHRLVLARTTAKNKEVIEVEEPIIEDRPVEKKKSTGHSHKSRTHRKVNRKGTK